MLHPSKTYSRAFRALKIYPDKMPKWRKIEKKNYQGKGGRAWD
jgi:hypothetical protein